MIDIIFHIGFSKCASSTLQDIVFSQTKGYLGIGRNTPEELNYASNFLKISPVGHNVKGNYVLAKRWAEQILEIKKEKYPNTNRLILSNEDFTARNLLNNRPIIPFLKKFNEKIWKEHGNLKLIIVIRNQPEKIASTYAQLSKLNTRASQKNFVFYTRKVLRKSFYKLDYYSWIKSLYATFGEDNICVLLMEDINKIDFWDELKNFADLNELNPKKMINNQNKANQRSVSKDIWKIRDYSPLWHAKEKIKIIKLIWPFFFLSKFKKDKLDVLELRLEKYYSNQFKRSNYQRENEIHLDKTIKHEIFATYKESNINLGKLLKRDLSEVGYY